MTVRGLIGTKIGTTEVLRESGEAVPVTAIQTGPCTITQIKTADKDGYEGVQLGYKEVRRRNKPSAGHLKKSGKLFRFLREVGADGLDDLEVGQELGVDLFQPGDKLDATGTSKGRGFAGVVKRHGFSGGPKTHGQSDRHRAPGSIGAGTSPGKVLKGKKMAGHMGNARVTVRNLEVVLSDAERNLLFVKGAVPGAHNSLLVLQKARRGS
jgi:large subunit ribosomal protein L3